MIYFSIIESTNHKRNDNKSKRYNVVSEHFDRPTHIRECDL